MSAQTLSEGADRAYPGLSAQRSARPYLFIQHGFENMFTFTRQHLISYMMFILSSNAKR